MATVTLRIDDELLAAIDRAASDAGISRSAIIKQTLAEKIEAAPAPSREPATDDRDRVEVKLRVHRAPFEALRRHAAAEHVLPSDLVRRLIHARYYGGEIPAPYSREAKADAVAIGAALSRIGNNINQATNAMHRAAYAGDDAAMKAAADDLKAWAADLSRHVDEARASAYALAQADWSYWAQESKAQRLKNRDRFGVV